MAVGEIGNAVLHTPYLITSSDKSAAEKGSVNTKAGV